MSPQVLSCPMKATLQKNMLGTFPFLGKHSFVHESCKMAAPSDLSAVVSCQDYLRHLCVWDWVWSKEGKRHPYKPTTESIFRNYQNVVQAFLHGDSFYSPSHTIRDAKTKTKQKQSEGLKSEDSSIRLEIFTTKHIYINNMVEFTCEILCFQSQPECKALYR